jgi:uncharacterized membrane protein YeaQ/YmgE (transglycosylase-associated protein family)
MKDEKITLNIPIYEIFLVIGIILIIIGILAPFQLIEIFNFELWLDPNLTMICVPIGIGFICGYITKKILPNKKGAYWLGFILGIIGIIITICIKINLEKNNNSRYDDLQKLFKLKQDGIITEAEFEAEKLKILKEK